VTASSPTGSIGRWQESLLARRLPAIRNEWKLLFLFEGMHLSGANSAACAVAGELARRGWRVEFFCVRKGFAQECDALRKETGVPVHELNVPTGEDGLTFILDALEAHAPAFVVLNYDWVTKCLAAARGDRLRFIDVVYSDDFEYYESCWRLRHHFDGYVAVSRRILERLHRLLPTARLPIAHAPCTTVRGDDLESAPTLQEPLLSFFYSGRLIDYQKRISELEAFLDALEMAGATYRFLLAGNGPQESKLRSRFAGLVRRGRVVFLGRLERHALVRHYQESNFFWLASDFEGLPAALVEAMASGCIPVCTRFGSGWAETAARHSLALELDLTAPGELVRRLQALSRDRIEAGRKEAQAIIRQGGLTVERTAHAYEGLFHEILSRNATSTHGTTRTERVQRAAAYRPRPHGIDPAALIATASLPNALVDRCRTLASPRPPTQDSSCEVYINHGALFGRSFAEDRLFHHYLERATGCRVASCHLTRIESATWEGASQLGFDFLKRRQRVPGWLWFENVKPFQLVAAFLAALPDWRPGDALICPALLAQEVHLARWGGSFQFLSLFQQPWVLYRVEPNAARLERLLQHGLAAVWQVPRGFAGLASVWAARRGFFEHTLARLGTPAGNDHLP